MYITGRFKIIAFLFLVSLGGFSQTSFNSPFSIKGLGDMAGNGFPRNSAMGGVGYGLRNSNYIDYSNPASYTARDSLSFIYDFGLQGKGSFFSNSDFSIKTYNLNLNHLAFSFPITSNVGFAFGILPYSYTGYVMNETVLQNDANYNPQLGQLGYMYRGDGGINRFFIGSAVKLFDHLSVGANFNYLFGEIKKTHTLTFSDNPNAFNIKIEDRIIVSDFNYDLGLQYVVRFGKEKKLVLGLTGGNNKRINYSEERLDYGVLILSNGTTHNDTLSYTKIYNENMLLPYHLGAGISISNGEKWSVAIDYYQQNWSKANIPFSRDSLTTTRFIRGGFQIVPNPRDFRRYWKIIAYRFGGHYGNSYFTINNNPVKDFGISFGVGLPIIMNRSTFNVSVETGWRGSVEKNYLLERYNVINFGLSFYDFWFIKRKYK